MINLKYRKNKFLISTKKLPLGLLLLVKTNLFCQLQSTVFQEFTQFITNYEIVNPSNIDTINFYKLNFHQVEEFSSLSDVKRMNFSFDKKIIPRDNKYHFYGFNFYNIKLGDFISKNYLYLKYSLLLKLNQKSSLSFGTNLGLMGLDLKSSNNGVGGSDYTIDGSFGFSLIKENFITGISTQQIFSPKLTPINQTFLFRRVYNLSIIKTLPFSQNFNFTFDSHFQFQKDRLTFHNISFYSNLYDFGIIGIGNFNFNKSYFMAGIKKLKINNFYLLALISYNIYHNKIPLPNNSIEFNLIVSKR